MEELRDAERQFYRERGMVYELEADEKPCAVIWLRNWPEDTAAVRRLGQAIAKWKESQPRLRRILGLTEMLQGAAPGVSTFVVWGRYYMKDHRPETWTQNLALATMASETQEGEGFLKANADLAASLRQVVEASGIANCQEHARYLYDNR